MISKLQLIDYRNFKKKLFEFSQDVSVIIGPNASGKTNLLESIYLISSGKSFKARIEEEMVNYQADLARIAAKSDENKLEVVLTRGLLDVGNGKPQKVRRKKLMVNGVPRRLVDFAGDLKAVIFGPWDMDFVTESPSLRRRFLDSVISQVDREYRRASLSYDKSLRQRNKLLLRIREEGLSRNQLAFWDRMLVKNGDYISNMREEFIDFVNKQDPLNTMVFNLYYDKSAISPTRLEQYADEEIAAATTLVGPHRDDFIFRIKNAKATPKIRDLDRFGSRGEQRMGILWLKLAELAFVEEKSAARPTLLLDDIFSELDEQHRDIVMNLAKKQQTIITTADEHFLEDFENLYKIYLK